MPKATEVAETESDLKPGFRLGKAPVPGHSPLCHPVEPALGPALSRWSPAAQELRAGAGQGQAGGAGWEPDLPWERRATSPTLMAARRQVLAWRLGLGPRAGAEKPPLPHASRTNKTLRSGLCEGLVAGRERRARGLSVALGDLLVPVFCELSAAKRSAGHRLTCAHLRLTRRRPGRPPQVRTWLAPPFLATLHPIGPCLAPSPAHASELVPKPGLSALLYGPFSPRP